MASYTLLDYTQAILSSLDSETVNSYSDTVESIQVANIIKTVYNDIQSRVDLPEHYDLFELNASGDNTQPVLMTRPADVSSIEWIQYDKVLLGSSDPAYRDVYFVSLDEFLRRMNSLKTTDTTNGTFNLTQPNSDTITFIYRNNKAPDYYTTFDDATIIFDSFDSAVDTTLQKTKTRAYGKKDQAFTLNDTFVPFLDRDLSTLLLNEAKVLAFSELKQVGHDVARQWANRGWTKVQQQKRGIDNPRNELDRAPNFGRGGMFQTSYRNPYNSY
jgi:hypothetical protein